MIFVLGGTGSWVGAIIFFGLLLLLGAFIAVMAAMCVVGPFLALHDWAIGKPGYQKFAKHIPGYMDWIERRLPEKKREREEAAAKRAEMQRETHSQWVVTRDVFKSRCERGANGLTPRDFENWLRKHPEPYDPDAHGDNGTAADVSRDEG